MNKTKIKYYCKICGNKISSVSALYGSGLCLPCAMKKYRDSLKGKNHPNLKHGKYSKDFHNQCKCGEAIAPLAKICKVCYNKIRATKRIERIKTFICLDCKKKISRKAVTHGKGRCPSCATINAFKENPELITNISKKALKRLSIPENNPMFGKHHTEEVKSKISLNHGGTGIPYEFSEYPLEFNNSLKEKIRDRDNHECQKCHIKEKNLDRELNVHHIDYNKENCEEENLISLCQSCHTKSNFNREEWIKYFKEDLICQKI